MLNVLAGIYISSSVTFFQFPVQRQVFREGLCYASWYYSSSSASAEAERTIREGPRNDWKRDEIKAVYDSPLLDLLFHGAQVHRHAHNFREAEKKKKQKDEIRREKDAIRCKVAIEKATARRIAKESMDLIEDEQLELMELAATSKGLPSVLKLDHGTLQNLELYRDSLSTFPPKALQLKMPFAISSWKDSEESVGNLLMVCSIDLYSLSLCCFSFEISTIRITLD